MASANARRFAYPLVLIALAAYFDFRLKGEPLSTLVIVAVALVPILLAQRPRPVARDLFGWVPPRYRALFAAAVPVAFLYLTRWRGQQDLWASLLVIGVPIGLGVLTVRHRGRLDRLVAPFAKARDRVLPRWACMVLATVVPLVLVFWLVHRNLSDIGALFGDRTANRSAVNSEGTAPRMIFATALSTVIAYLLLAEPRPEGRP